MRLFAFLVLGLATTACSSEGGTSPPSAEQRASSACAVGELTRAEDGKCVAPGVGTCAEGFRGADEGCTAILPESACPKGKMAVPGETACREVALCANGTWGDIPVEASTQYVDAAYAGPTSDGSAASPWKTIGQAITAASPGAIVAIAAGAYAEDVKLDGKAVRLWGRCPSMVTITGTGTASQSILIRRSKGAEVHDLGVTSTLLGFAISGSEVVLDRVWVHDTGSSGVEAADTLGPADVTVRRSLLEALSDVGVHIGGAALRLEQSIVRDTRDSGRLDVPGGGVGVEPGPRSRARGALTVTSSVVERNEPVGVYAVGADATVEATVIRNGRAWKGKTFGRGLTAEADKAQRASMSVRGSVIESNLELGMFVYGSDATVEGTTIRDTAPEIATQQHGEALSVASDATAGRGNLTVRSSLFERNHSVALLVYGADAVVEATLLRDTHALADQSFGRGAALENDGDSRSVVRMSGVRVDRNIDAGLFIGSSDVRLESVLVRGTAAAADGQFGDGLSILAGSQVTLTGSRVEGNARAGIGNFAAEVTIAKSSFECNAVHLEGEEAFTFHDEGQNVCGCGGATSACAAASSNLAPPSLSPGPKK